MEKLYNRTNWVDNSEPDIDAEHLNNIENGIDNLDLRITELKMLGWTVPSDFLIKNEIEHLADGDYFVQKVTRDKRFGKEYIYYELNQPIRTKISGNEAVQKINEDMSLIQSEVSFATINDCEIGYAWTGESGYPKRATAFINVKPNTEYSYKIGLSSYINDVSICEKTSRTSTTKITEKLITEDGTYSITTSDTTKVLVIEFNSRLELNEYYLKMNFLGLYVPDMLRDMNESILGINDGLLDLAYGEVAGGKNLFDKQLMTNPITEGQWIHLKLKPNTKYTMSTNAPTVSGGALVFFLAGNVETDASSSTNGVSNTTPRTVTSDSNGYVSVSYRIINTTSPFEYNWQIEEGESVTTFEDYVMSNKQLGTLNNTLQYIGKGKNILNSTLKSTSSNGITVTENNGTYTVSGTASADTVFWLHDTMTVTGINNKIKVVGCPKGGSKPTYSLSVYIKNTSGTGAYIEDTGNGYLIDTKASSLQTIRLYINIKNGTVCNNLVFKPMISEIENATYDDFVPYTGSGKNLIEDVSTLKADLSTAQSDIIKRMMRVESGGTQSTSETVVHLSNGSCYLVVAKGNGAWGDSATIAIVSVGSNGRSLTKLVDGRHQLSLSNQDLTIQWSNYGNGGYDIWLL